MVCLQPTRVSQALVVVGSLVGLAGAALYLGAAVGLVAFEEVTIEDPLETTLFVVLLGTPYLLALWGAAVLARHRAFALTALALATASSLTHPLLAALSVLGLVFLVAATLLACGSASLVVSRFRGDAGATR